MVEVRNIHPVRTGLIKTKPGTLECNIHPAPFVCDGIARQHGEIVDLMKRVFSLIIFLVIGACAGTHDKEKSALLLEKEVERLTGLCSLWPRFEPMAIPLAIYDGELTYLFRHPTPPEGFVAVGQANPSVFAWKGRHPAVTANASADIGETTTASLCGHKDSTHSTSSASRAASSTSGSFVSGTALAS